MSKDIPDNQELVRQRFGQNASAYVTSKSHAKGGSLARLVELTGPQPDWQVLDIATGAGHTALVFAPHVAGVIASDITPQMLATVERLAGERGIHNLSVRIADAHNLPFEEASFDLVTARIAPHHFPGPQKFVQESARVLRPGGLFALVDNIVPEDPQAGAYINRVEKHRDPSHVRCLPLSEWSSLVEAAGLVLQQREISYKNVDFEVWTNNQKASDALKSELKDMLERAPAAARDFLQPRETDGAYTFRLAEGILVAKK